LSKKIVALTVALFVLVALSSSAAWSADFVNASQGYDAGIWFTSMYGNVKYTGTLSLRGDLSLKQNAGFIADAEWRLNDKWGAQFNYFRIQATGDNTISKDLVFNGRNIFNGDQLHSRLSITHAAFMAKYNIYRNSESQFDIMAGVKYIDFNLNIRNNGAGGGNRFTFDLHPSGAVPVLGLSGKQRIAEGVYLFGDFSGIFDLGGGNIKNGNLIDFKGGLRWNFTEPGWYATAEYRVFGSKIERTNGNSANIYWNGPAVTIRYEF